MNTKEEAEKRLAELPLKVAVVVADTARLGAPRRAYTFDSGGGTVEVEIDAEPSDAQLRDLARHLPCESKDSAAVLAKLLEPVALPIAEPVAEPTNSTLDFVAFGVAAAATIAEIAHALGAF